MGLVVDCLLLAKVIGMQCDDDMQFNAGLPGASQLVLLARCMPWTGAIQEPKVACGLFPNPMKVALARC